MLRAGWQNSVQCAGGGDEDGDKTVETFTLFHHVCTEET